MYRTGCRLLESSTKNQRSRVEKPRNSYVRDHQALLDSIRQLGTRLTRPETESDPPCVDRLLRREMSQPGPRVSGMDIILIAGLWLPRSIWGDVVAELERLGHRALPVALPGVDDGSSTATLDDQVAAALETVDAADRPMVVGHSAACTIAWMVADQRPDAIESVVMIGGFPGADGEVYADFFPSVDGVMAFPGWEPFEGPDAADLDEAARERIASAAVSVPEGVSKGVVRLGDDSRYDVRILLVCPEYSPEQARKWIDAGDVPELSRATSLSFVDIDSGHWPMVSQPAELARILDMAANEG